MVNFSKIYLGLIFKDRGYFLHMSFVGTMNLSLPILVVFESKEFTKQLILTFLIMPFQYTRLLSIYKVTFWELIFSYVHLLSIITSKHDDAITKVTRPFKKFEYFERSCVLFMLPLVGFMTGATYGPQC